MRITIFVIVVHVHRPDRSLQGLERLQHARHDVRVTNVEADANIVDPPSVKQFQQLLRRGKLVGNVLYQQLYAQWFGEGVEVFERSYRSIEFVLVGLFVADPDMLHQKLKGRLLSYLDGTLYFIGRGDTLQLLDRCNVDRRIAATPQSSSECMGECMEWKVTPVLRNQLATCRTCCRSV